MAPDDTSVVRPLAAGNARLAALADDLERTLRTIGAWSEPAPPLVPFSRPFATDAMPFEHWLQLVLIPRMRTIAAGGEPLPMRSNLAPHALRELDGREAEMAPLIDVLRAIDDLCPPPTGPGAGDTRRGRAALALVVPVLAWTVIAFHIGRWGAAAATNLFPPRIVQTWTGTIAPGADFRPLRITLTAEVHDGDTLSPRDAYFLVTRSMPTMLRGPTAPLRFRATVPPAPADVVTWLTTFGAEPGPAALAAATEASTLAGAAAAARTREAMRALTARADGPRADAPVELVPRAPAWVAIAVTILAFLAGALPITIVVARWARR